MRKRVTQEIDPWDVGPAEALAIGVGCDTGAQKAEMANAKPHHLPAWSGANSALCERTITLVKLVRREETGGGRGRAKGQ